MYNHPSTVVEKYDMHNPILVAVSSNEINGVFEQEIIPESAR